MADKKDIVATATTFGLTKYVHLMYVVAAFVMGWLFVKTIETGWIAANLYWTWVPPAQEWTILGIGVVGSAILTAYLWRHQRVNTLSVEIVHELSKVTWPTKKELSASTVVVIVFSIIASIILGLFDFFWSWCTDYIYHSGG